MPNGGRPRFAATLTTSRLVEVPMVVHMPPIRVAKPIGIRILLGDEAVRRQTLMRMGSSSTTMGVLLMKADSAPAISSIAAKERMGDLTQNWLSRRPKGSSAPVCMRPWPRIMRAQTAISASWPKPAKNCAARKLPNGNRVNPAAKTASSPMLAFSSRAPLRLNSASASTVSSMDAKACMLGISGMFPPLKAPQRWPGHRDGGSVLENAGGV